jgi:hypothetical protein
MDISKPILIQSALLVYAVIVICVKNLKYEYNLIFDSLFVVVSLGSSFGYISYIRTRSIIEVTLLDRYALKKFI